MRHEKRFNYFVEDLNKSDYKGTESEENKN